MFNTCKLVVSQFRVLCLLTDYVGCQILRFAGEYLDEKENVRTVLACS